MEREGEETPVEGTAEEELDVDEMFGSDSPSGSDSDAPLVKPKTEAKKATVHQTTNSTAKATTTSTLEPMVSTVPGTDDEASEDNDHELTQWEQIDMKPAIEMIEKLTKTSVDAAKEFNATVVATSHQLVSGCDSVLLEIKHISDIRENMKRKATTSAMNPVSNTSHALGTSMLPLSLANSAALSAPQNPQPTPVMLDKSTEDQTDRVLYKIEASIEKFRELAEMIQTTSMNHEALLLQKLKVPPATIQTMVTAVHNAAAAATSAAIAQDRHRLVARTFSSDQRTKLQTWYYSYPRPLADELDLMSSILSYPPYTTSPISSIHPQHVRDWFKRRRFRERMRSVMQAVEAGTPLHVAEADVRARMELRIQTLREAVSPEELVREFEQVRLNSSTYSSVAGSFGNKRNLDQFLSVAQAIPSHDLAKKQRVNTSSAQQGEGEFEEAILVKVASKFEVEAIQVRLSTLLKAPKTTANTNNIQQVMDVLRSLEVSKELYKSSGLVSSLKKILKVYKKPSLLRRTTEALMETLGQSYTKKSKRSSANPTPPPPPPTSTMSVTQQLDYSSPSDPKQSGSAKRKKGAKLLRPMKFSMKQVEALEGWFQKTFKPTQAEMEEYLDALNSAPLREPKQTVDVNMTQLRRWFNKRRCLRRPPFALLTKDKKEGDEDATQDDEEEDEDDDDEEDEADEVKSNEGSASFGDMNTAVSDEDEDNSSVDSE